MTPVRKTHLIMQIKYRLGILRVPMVVLSIAALLLASADAIGAQVSDPDWSQPIQLSSADADTDSTSQPAVIADRYGIVHAFWSERSVLNNQVSLMHAQFDGLSWSAPIAIVTNFGLIFFPRVTQDQYNIIHLTWVTSLAGPVYYTKVHALQAGDSQRWSTPLIINAPAYQAVLYAGNDDSLHLIYSKFQGTLGGVWHSMSTDQGLTWSNPTNLDPARPLDYYTQQMYVELGNLDEVHVTWWYMQLSNGNNGAVMYARSQDSGETWEPPISIDSSSSVSPTITMISAAPRMAISGANVVIIWGRGEIGKIPAQRHTRISADSGATWNQSEPIASFGSLHGQAFDGIAVDGDGRAHYLADIRYPQGFYHAVWDKTQWLSPSKFFDIVLNPDGSPAPGSIHVHYASAAVRSGNQLITVFMNSPTDPQGMVYAMQRTLDDVVTPPEVYTLTYLPLVIMQP